jgi:hypothetical protein
MKKLLVLVLTMALAGSAFAVVDTDANSLGFYADLTADTVVIQNAAPYSTQTVYVILANPNFDGLWGIEFGYDIVGSAIVLSTTWANPQALDVGSPGNHIVGFGNPSATTEATLVATLSVLYSATDGTPMEMTLTGTEPSSIDPLLPTLLLQDGVLVSSGDSTDIGNVNFSINGEAPVATDHMTIDAVKSLYR